MKGRVLMVSIETLGKLARQTTIAAPRSCRALSFLTRCTRIVERKRIFCNAERERIPRLKRRGRRGGGIECRKSENISKRGGKRGKRGRKGLKRGKIVDKSFSFQIIKSSWRVASVLRRPFKPTSGHVSSQTRRIDDDPFKPFQPEIMLKHNSKERPDKRESSGLAPST